MSWAACGATGQSTCVPRGSFLETYMWCPEIYGVSSCPAWTLAARNLRGSWDLRGLRRVLRGHWRWRTQVVHGTYAVSHCPTRTLRKRTYVVHETYVVSHRPTRTAAAANPSGLALSYVDLGCSEPNPEPPIVLI